LTRTRVLKAEPEEDVGDDGRDVSQQEDEEDSEDINDEQGPSNAGRNKEGQGQRYHCEEIITSGQSGDCLVYFQGLIYILDCARTMVCAHNKRTFLPIRSGVMNNPPIGLFARVVP
jgi:hypothetical protein